MPLPLMNSDMKKLVVLLTLLCVPSNLIALERSVGSFQFVARNRNHTARLTVKTRVFIRSNHKLTFPTKQYLKKHQISPGVAASLVTKVDGREPLGTDGTVPRVELELMVVAFEGKKVIVPRSLYADCFNPSLENEVFATKLNETGDSLLVFMAASDGAGRYQVMWILRKDGSHSRFVNNCSDCDSSGVFNFFP
jgi:hypothetical protein